MAWLEGQICPCPVLGEMVTAIHSLTVCGIFLTTAPKKSQEVVAETLRLMTFKIFTIFPFMGQNCCPHCIPLYDYDKQYFCVSLISGTSLDNLDICFFLQLYDVPNIFSLFKTVSSFSLWWLVRDWKKKAWQALGGGVWSEDMFVDRWGWASAWGVLYHCPLQYPLESVPFEIVVNSWADTVTQPGDIIQPSLAASPRAGRWNRLATVTAMEVCDKPAHSHSLWMSTASNTWYSSRIPTSFLRESWSPPFHPRKTAGSSSEE